jgi:dipeptidyl aminopeptidase/acylaminoacyl peptidase
VAVPATLLLYTTTGEDLEVVLLRNTIERQVYQFWRSVAGDESRQNSPTGTISGLVLDDGTRPLEGASVIVSEVNGQVYSATSGVDGRFLLESVPEGHYLPMAAAPGYRQGRAHGTFDSRVIAVRPGMASEATFRLSPTQQVEIETGTQLTFGAEATSSVDNPEPSTALRREFTYTRAGTTLSGGLVHEPPAGMGPGPFPILLLIFPGPANAWEGISIPLAAKGYLVVSYFPVRLLDLEGDVDDLMLLLKLTADGRMSERGDRDSIALVGGSVSTVYTYLMAREIQGSDTRQQVKALIQYGGLFDFFQFRKDWEEGRVIIDPGLSDLEYLLVAFGRPDSRPEIYLRLSPRYALGPDTLPPTLFVHTGNDIVVPPNQSDIGDTTLQTWGTPSQYLFYPNSEHYLDTSKPDPTQVDMLDRTLAFLDLYMK